MKIDINKILTDPKIDQLDPVTLRWLLDVLLAVKSNDLDSLIDTVLAVIEYYDEMRDGSVTRDVTENVTRDEMRDEKRDGSVTRDVTENVTRDEMRDEMRDGSVTPMTGAERSKRYRDRLKLRGNVTKNVTRDEKRDEIVTQEKEKSTKKEKELRESLLNSQQNNLINNNFNNADNENLNKNNTENNQNNFENELNNSENNLKVKQNTVNLTARDEKRDEKSVTRDEKNKKAVTQKPKLSPEQPEYWQHAFGPNAEMAERFSKISGIIPVGSEFGLWQKSLKEYREAGITIDQMEAAVIKYRTDMPNATIKGPNSVFSIARDLKSRKAIAVPEKSEESIMDVARRLQRERDMQEKELEMLP